MTTMCDQAKAKRIKEILDAAEADGVIVYLNNENHVIAVGRKASQWAPAIRPHSNELQRMMMNAKLESLKLFARIRSKQS